MDGTQEDTKPLTRRLAASQRLLVLVGVAVLVTTAGVGVGVAALGDTTLITDHHQDTIVGIAVGQDETYVYSSASAANGQFTSKTNIASRVVQWNSTVDDGRDLYTDSAGAVYFWVTDNAYKLDSNGNTIWSSNPLGAFVDSLGLTPDQDYVYIGGTGGDFAKLESGDGSTVYSITELGGSTSALETISTDSDNSAYAGRLNGQLLKVNATGSIQWTVSENDMMMKSDVSNDGRFVIGAFDPVGNGYPSHIMRYNTSNGSTEWASDVFVADANGLDIGPAGKFVYVASDDDSDVKKINATTGDYVANISVPFTPNRIEINENGGTAYIGTLGGEVYQLDVGAPTNLDTSIYGTVSDSNGDGIEDANVNITNQDTNNHFNTTTDLNGNYLSEVPNGTYDVTASIASYSTVTKTAVVDGNSTEVNFELAKLNDSLELDVKRYIAHGKSEPYKVWERDLDNGSREDVTNTSTVTSGNTTVITVNTGDNLLEATSDRSINQRVLITATHNGKTATETVTVANKTVDHIDILPPWARLEATVNCGTEDNPDHCSFMIIMIATFVAVAGTLLMSTFVGLGGFSVIIIAGWLIGLTSTGLLLVVLTIVGFVGLNLAANIDYSVR